MGSRFLNFPDEQQSYGPTIQLAMQFSYYILYRGCRYTVIHDPLGQHGHLNKNSFSQLFAG